MTRERLLCIILMGFCGCATLSPKQEGRITSNPPGARITANKNLSLEEGDRFHFGYTPCDIWIKQGLFDTWLFADLNGYETGKWLIPRRGRIDHHFELARDFSLQIKDEKDSYDKEYVRGVIDILGKYEEVLSSPRMLAGIATSKAKTAWEQLRYAYPEYNSRVVDMCLALLFAKAAVLTSLPSSAYNTGVEIGLVKEMQQLIRKVKKGLGIF